MQICKLQIYKYAKVAKQVINVNQWAKKSSVLVASIHPIPSIHRHLFGGSALKTLQTVSSYRLAETQPKQQGT